ncbi:MAG: hypothetical protein HUJ69_04865 [Lachnospiraceae bacterium]|nr:hypothetical protein [Lachnospiraceae bacterium]
MKKVLLIIRDLLILAAVALVVVLTLHVLKAQDHYVTDESVQDYLVSDNTVAVESGIFSILFDGPGEDSVLIFYGTTDVEAAAYAPLLHDLAAGGLDCIVVRMPIRDPRIFNKAAAIKMLEYQYHTWYVGGHGIGAEEAGEYASEHPEDIDGLICLAGFPTEDLSEAPFKGLLIYGSADGVFEPGNYRDKAPFLCAEKVIQGGNYSQFGCFGLYDGDGAASIDEEAQRRETVDCILDQLNISPEDSEK